MNDKITYFSCLQMKQSCVHLLRDNFDRLFDAVVDVNNVISALMWSYAILFVLLLLTATIGKKFGIRKQYILLLDKLFFYAAVKIKTKGGTKDDPEEDHEEEFIPIEEVVLSPECPKVKVPTVRGQFEFDDAIPYITAGMQSIVQDFATESFTPIKLESWNMLSRTKKEHNFSRSKSVTLLWLIGFLIRYVLLVPVRLVILAISLTTMVTCTFLVGRLPDGEFKRKVNAMVVCWSFDFVANTLSVIARFHNKENRPSHGIAVANHTSPIDSMVLATDNCYDMVGQITGGFLGIFMSSLSKSSTHIWFERTNAEQRRETFKKLNAHSQNKDLPPVLIFPEGICVNNSAVLMFRKGVFELDTVIYPIAIKFDPRYGDAFWYKYGFFFYIVSMISSWGLVCDVWYLPPMQRGENEDSVTFAKRVKSSIAGAGGFREIEWDGIVKIFQEKQQNREKFQFWLQRQQIEFAKNFLDETKTIL